MSSNNTTGTPCHLCGRPSGDDAYACTACAETLRDALREITGEDLPHGLADDLDTALAKQGTKPAKDGAKHTKASEAPLPIDVRASEAAGVLRSTLSTWVRLIHDDGSKQALPDDTLPAMAAWLLPLCGWLRHADYGPECIDEITAAVQQARRAVDTPPSLDYSGRCATCQQPVYAPIGVTVARCRTPECHGTVDDVPTQKLHELRRLGGHLMTPAEASACLDRAGWELSASAIRGHAGRGNIDACGTRKVQTRSEHPGTPRRIITVAVYRFDDILNLLAASGRTKKAAA